MTKQEGCCRISTCSKTVDIGKSVKLTLCCLNTVRINFMRVVFLGSLKQKNPKLLLTKDCFILYGAQERTRTSTSLNTNT